MQNVSAKELSKIKLMVDNNPCISGWRESKESKHVYRKKELKEWNGKRE